MSDCNCAARMDDGRHFTDYSPNCNLNMSIQNDNSINNSYEYRQFLLNNGGKLMNKYRSHVIDTMGCNLSTADYNNGTMLNEKYKWVTDGKTCKHTLVDPNGLGTGVQYRNHEECPMITRKQQSNSCASTNNVFNYYNHSDSMVNGRQHDVQKNNSEPQPYNL